MLSKIDGHLHRDLVLLIKRPFTSSGAVHMTPINVKDKRVPSVFFFFKKKDNNFNRMNRKVKVKP